MVEQPVKPWVSGDPLDIERVKYQADLLHALLMDRLCSRVKPSEAEGKPEIVNREAELW